MTDESVAGAGLMLVPVGMLIHIVHVYLAGVPPGHTWTWWLPFIGIAMMLVGAILGD